MAQHRADYEALRKAHFAPRLTVVPIERLERAVSLLKERDRDRRVIDGVLSDYKNRKLVLRIADYCNRTQGACGIALRVRSRDGRSCTRSR